MLTNKQIGDLKWLIIVNIIKLEEDVYKENQKEKINKKIVKMLLEEIEEKRKTLKELNKMYEDV